MPRIEINGLSIAYDLIGPVGSNGGDKAITITPGGRFSRDTPGVRELATELAANGYKALNLGRPLVYGASGGSREALLTAIRHPDCVSGVFCQWLSGGGIGIATLPMSYNHDPAIAASLGGMQGVAEMPPFAELLTRNPRNRELLFAWEPQAFIRRMRDWADWFFCAPGMPISCVRAGELEGIKVPVVILRSGKSDIHHTRETSEAVAAMIPGADLQEPPWGDREWMERLEGSFKEGTGLFLSMPKLVPQILALASSCGVSPQNWSAT